jgi:hypothetical protein
MQYSLDNIQLIETAGLDREKCRWSKRLCSNRAFQLPICADVHDTTCLITDFNSKFPVSILLKNLNITELFLLSVDSYGTESISTTEWGKLYSKSMELGVDFELLKPEGVEAKDFRDVAEAADKWPEEFLSYLDRKRVHWSVLKLILLTGNGSVKLMNYAVNNNLSVQAFRNLAEDARDFGDNIDNIIDRRCVEHRLLDEELANLNKSLSLLTVTNPTNFETNKLSFSFAADKAEQFNSAAALINANIAKVRRFYELMKETGI